jgi:transcription initiation factor TFIIH subunit 4
MGIVHKVESTSSALFYPSFVAVNMIFRQQNSNLGLVHSSADEQSMDLRIIVETNFQVCAYVQSELHLEMLKLFVEVSVRFPNMAFGTITSSKAKKAFSMGITAGQVVDFLTSHAHAQVRERLNVIPQNVHDQLVLWEAELDRLNAEDVVILGNFS